MNGSRRLDLYGLRGLAVVLVVGFHAGLPVLRVDPGERSEAVLHR